MQTRQQLKNKLFHERQRIFVNKFAFGHLAANVRVRCIDFSKLLVYAVYSNRHAPSLFGEQCEILRWRTLRKTLKRWWGRLDKRWVATESGGDETDSPGDETGDKTAATAGDKRDGGDRRGNVCGRQSVYNRRPPSLYCVVYCLLCYVLVVVYHSTVLCQQSKAKNISMEII